MSDSDDIDLFAELSAEDRLELDRLNTQRQRQHDDTSDPAAGPSTLSFQRRRYLQNAFTPTPATLCLKSQPPVNLGQPFSPAERQAILAMLRTHTGAQGWTQGRHGAFPTRDIPLAALPSADSVRSTLAAYLFPQLEKRTGISRSFWAFRDLFVIGYHAENQRALEVHTDGCLASLTMLLNEPDEFAGGGTYFADFGMLIRQTPGDAWVHDAKLRHSGVEITEGVRIVLAIEPSGWHSHCPISWHSPGNGGLKIGPPCSATHCSYVGGDGGVLDAGGSESLGVPAGRAYAVAAKTANSTAVSFIVYVRYVVVVVYE
ncbi:hypothetical protein LPJ53_000604 [Coemansia erecta]|uniref:Prolyl 4-hydroxylase alpha subunit domain-containing protein n=1 Tax=Coemansia erecta TaxID=147472 RepID=A0A9W7Y553_9FUNG|nr:hypothetical protein LPJ53_000604 [Coemansia erecta]